jgi:hypothetical protein
MIPNNLMTRRMTWKFWCNNISNFIDYRFWLGSRMHTRNVMSFHEKNGSSKHCWIPCFFLLKMITKSDCRVGIVLLPMPINISCKRKSSIHPLLGPS